LSQGSSRRREWGAEPPGQALEACRVQRSSRESAKPCSLEEAVLEEVAPATIQGSAAGLSASLPDSFAAPDSLPAAPVDTSFSTTVPNLRGRSFEP